MSLTRTIILTERMHAVLINALEQRAAIAGMEPCVSPAFVVDLRKLTNIYKAAKRGEIVDGGPMPGGVASR